jgi:hypothetical protein
MGLQSGQFTRLGAITKDRANVCDNSPLGFSLLRSEDMEGEGQNVRCSFLLTLVQMGAPPITVGPTMHSAKMRSHDHCAHAWDRWFQEFLTKMAYHPPKFPTERQTEQLLELAERIGSPTQIRKGASQSESADFS